VRLRPRWSRPAGRAQRAVQTLARLRSNRRGRYSRSKPRQPLPRREAKSNPTPHPVASSRGDRIRVIHRHHPATDVGRRARFDQLTAAHFLTDATLHVAQIELYRLGFAFAADWPMSNLSYLFESTLTLGGPDNIVNIVVHYAPERKPLCVPKQCQSLTTHVSVLRDRVCYDFFLGRLLTRASSSANFSGRSVPCSVSRRISRLRRSAIS
jgi:hypothetical protein